MTSENNDSKQNHREKVEFEKRNSIIESLAQVFTRETK